MAEKIFSKKIYFFIGTTAELIKLSPVIRELEQRQIDFKIIVSGQTNINFKELSLVINRKKADITLKAKKNKTSVFLFLLWAIRTFVYGIKLREEFRGLNRGNSYFIVHGDTVSSLIGAVWAKLYKLKLVHIESGLTSYSLTEPFPEELSRRIISKLAEIHYCPNAWSVNNLSHLKGVKVNTFQNTLIESNTAILKKNYQPNHDLDLKNKKYFVLIVHRQEHVVYGREETKRLINFIIRQSKRKLVCVFVCHITTIGLLNSLELKNIKREIIISPRLTYRDFIKLLESAEYLVTDGGSNQEEAYYMGLPCLLLRKHTERIEGLGENVVLSKNRKDVIRSFIKNYQEYRREKVRFDIPPSKIIVDHLVREK